MRGSAAFRAAVAPGGVLAGPWVKNELWRRARAVPSLDLRFAENKSLVDATTGAQLVTFTRASSGTFVDSAGVIQSASTDVPRFDHNPTTGESLGLLVEEAGTNLLLQSNGFDTTWTNSNSTETGSAGTSPDGTNNAWELKDTSDVSATLHSLTQSSLSFTAGTTYTASLFVKAGTLSQASIAFAGTAFTTNKTAVFDTSTQTFPSTTNLTGAPTATAFPNGWYRIVVSFVADVTATGTMGIRTASGGTASYIGAGTGTILIFGAQLEAGAFPTSYIPTTSATVTRSADVASITTLGARFRSLYAQFRSPASGTRPIVSLDDNTANERIEILTSGTDPKLLVTDGGSAVADLDAGTVAANANARIAARFNTDDYAISINGGTSQLDTAGTLPTVDRIRIGSNQAGGYFNGTIARIIGWDAALPNLPPITQ